MTARRHTSPTLRRGSLSIECLVGLALIGVTLVTVYPLLARAASAQADLADRGAALRELRRLCQQGMHDPATPLEVSAAFRQQTDHPQLDVQKEPLRGNPAGERVRLRLQWEDSLGREVSPVEMTFWRFHQGEDNQ